MNETEPGPAPEAKPKRETKSYMTLYTGLQAKVNAALTLAPFIKVEKGSQEMWVAMQGLLKGNGS